ncbi:MAG: hypothetical protein KDB96_14025, partial [Flavobacteriales bacterium]|nr:hypothetical protein [Flavobacteriales bacterium]
PGVEEVRALQGGNAYELACATGARPAGDVFRLCAQRHWTLTELTPVETRLEDVFRGLTLN